MSIGVLVALDGRSEEDLVRALAATPDLTVTRRCADTQELLAAAIAQVGAVAVTGASEGIDRMAVERLLRAGVRTLVVAPATEHDRIRRIGACPADPGADLIEAIRSLAGDEPVASPPPPNDRDAPAPGRLVAVCGPTGSPGRSTIAINLAREIALGGDPVLLIDADIWGAAVAQMLGMLTDSAGLAAAARAAERGTLTVADLRIMAPELLPHLQVLSGLPRSSRWREISAASMQTILEVASRTVPWVVIDAPVHFPEDDGEYEPMLGPGRNAVADVVRTAADHMLLVGAAEPIGIERLVHSVLDSDRPDHTVVVNRVRAAAAGPRPQESVREALARFAGVMDAVLIPDDRPAADRTLLHATTWADAAPKSPARLGVQELARRITGAAPQPTGIMARLRQSR